MDWEKRGETTWKCGVFEIYEVDADHGRRKTYELCMRDEYLGDFRTLQLAKEAADAEWDRRAHEAGVQP